MPACCAAAGGLASFPGTEDEQEAEEEEDESQTRGVERVDSKADLDDENEAGELRLLLLLLLLLPRWRSRRA